MSLADVLDQRASEPTREEWSSLVDELFNEVRAWITEYPPLSVGEWSVLVQDSSGRFNLPALTVHFDEDQVTLQPRSFTGGRHRQIEAVSGARAAVLEYIPGQGWTYAWEGIGAPPKALTKEAFLDEILAGLLR